MGMPAADLLGMKFGKLTVLRRAPKGQYVNLCAHWICLCECGSEKVCPAGMLVRGRINSCGKNGCRVRRTRKKRGPNVKPNAFVKRESEFSLVAGQMNGK